MKNEVVILGASDNPSRYAYKAFKMLESFGYPTVLVNPNIKSVEGKTVFAALKEIKTTPHTLTMYVGEKISASLTDQILQLQPKRVIFNPGSENRELEKKLKANGIDVIEDCTLVMLQGHRF